MLRVLCAFSLAAILAGCSDLKDSYGKEYVLFDSRRDAATAPAPADSAVANEAPDFARILLLEQVRGELERAILEGLDRDGALARKRRAVEDELRDRVAAAGPALQEWRAARARELEQFATTR